MKKGRSGSQVRFETATPALLGRLGLVVLDRVSQVVQTGPQLRSLLPGCQDLQVAQPFPPPVPVPDWTAISLKKKKREN